jgi:hypothetical protein
MDKSAPPAKVRFVCPQNGCRVFCPACNLPMTHKREEWAWPTARLLCDAHGPLARGD